ncbi:MAG: hemolysin family protein [Pseudohongiellaceae bacterium]
MGLLVTFFVASIFFSFLCSILEAVLLSITPAYVATQDKDSTAISRKLSRFKEDIDRPLAAILTLNTIAHTVGAIGVGAQAAHLFGSTQIKIFELTIISWEGFIAGAMTLAILILSEVIPKTLGANNWQALAPISIRLINLLMIVLAPMIWLTQLITKNLKKDKDKPVLSRSDFLVMTELGKEIGILKESEQKIIINLLRFNRILVKDVMTPRIVVVAENGTMTIQQFHDRHSDLAFSRIPVYQESNDKVTGYILKDEVLLSLVEGKGEEDLNSLRRDIIISHSATPIPDLLDKFIAENEHIALVVDEYGGTEGIVTMEDLIETLLGIEIVDEMDNAEDMRALARKNWEIRARRIGLLPTETET